MPVTRFLVQFKKTEGKIHTEGAFTASFLYTAYMTETDQGIFMTSEQYQGKVKQYNSEKGFGFISSPEGEVFFHISDFPADAGEPKRNDRVKFNVIQNGDRYKAIKIERIEDHSKKAKKAKAVAVNSSITSALLSNLKR